MIAPEKGDYFKVRMNKRTVLVQISAVFDNGLITGWHVNKHGERVEIETKTAIQFGVLIFRLKDLRQRMVMNRHYAELQKA